MIEQKENDLVLSVMNNMQLTPGDLKAAGLTANNTSLLKENDYKRSSQIMSNPMFQNESGQFDDNKFHKFYENTKKIYDLIADDTYKEDLKKSAIYGANDIFAPKNATKKSHQDNIQLVRFANPNRVQQSMITLGQRGKQTLSDEEIAEIEKWIDGWH